MPTISRPKVLSEKIDTNFCLKITIKTFLQFLTSDIYSILRLNLLVQIRFASNKFLTLATSLESGSDKET